MCQVQAVLRAHVGDGVASCIMTYLCQNGRLLMQTYTRINTQGGERGHACGCNHRDLLTSPSTSPPDPNFLEHLTGLEVLDGVHFQELYFISIERFTNQSNWAHTCEEVSTLT